MFSTKAIKIDEIFTVGFMLCSKRQIDGEDFVNFRGLLKNMIFTTSYMATQNNCYIEPDFGVQDFVLLKLFYLHININ